MWAPQGPLPTAMNVQHHSAAVGIGTDPHRSLYSPDFYRPHLAHYMPHVKDVASITIIYGNKFCYLTIAYEKGPIHVASLDTKHSALHCLLLVNWIHSQFDLNVSKMDH